MYPIDLNVFKSIDFLSLKPQLLFTERRDTKFLFHKTDLPEILNSLKDDYILVTHHGKSSQVYATTYYDSSDLKYYLAHHNGHGNRMKVRTRTYEDGSSFFEIKQKTNKGITLKERQNFEEQYIEGLAPKLEVIYERITLYDIHLQEKLTIDFNLKYLEGDTTINYPELIIAESKKIKNVSSSFMTLMKVKRIEKVSLSKYCLGIVSLFNDVKKNNFKGLVNKIQKLNNKYDLSAAN